MKNKIKLLPLLLVTATLVACGGGGSGGSSINGNPSDVGNPIEVVNPPIEVSSYQIKVTPVTNNNAIAESSPGLDFSTPVTNLIAVVENRFTVGKDAESECITDNITGLMWPKDANLFKNDMEWNNALDAVAAMNGNNNSAVANNLCGYKDWHLPTVNELTSLINYEDEVKLVEFLKMHGFSGVQAHGYWSSTSDAPNANSAWYVNFYYGDVDADLKSYGNYVWPVRRVK